VSTTEQGKSGLGLEAQRKAAADYIANVSSARMATSSPAPTAITALSKYDRKNRSLGTNFWFNSPLLSLHEKRPSHLSVPMSSI
jgi:hypothetical protein